MSKGVGLQLLVIIKELLKSRIVQKQRTEIWWGKKIQFHKRGFFFLSSCVSAQKLLREEKWWCDKSVSSWCSSLMFIHSFLLPFFHLTPDDTFPCYMAPLKPWELFFNRHMVSNAQVLMRMSQADSFLLHFIVMASRQNHGCGFILIRACSDVG